MKTITRPLIIKHNIDPHLLLRLEELGAELSDRFLAPDQDMPRLVRLATMSSWVFSTSKGVGCILWNWSAPLNMDSRSPSFYRVTLPTTFVRIHERLSGSSFDQPRNAQCFLFLIIFMLNAKGRYILQDLPSFPPAPPSHPPLPLQRHLFLCFSALEEVN